MFPTGISCDKNIDIKDISFKARSEIDQYNYDLCMSLYADIDDAELYDGFPVALQAIGLPWTDEEVIQAVEVIQKAL